LPQGNLWEKTKILARSYYQFLRASILNSSNDSENNQLDKSIIEIYAQQDKFGRKNYWDTNTSYQITIKKAYPIDGDIIINDPKQNSFKTTDLIADLLKMKAAANITMHRCSIRKVN